MWGHPPAKGEPLRAVLEPDARPLTAWSCTHFPMKVAWFVVRMTMLVKIRLDILYVQECGLVQPWRLLRNTEEV